MGVRTQIVLIAALLCALVAQASAQLVYGEGSLQVSASAYHPGPGGGSQENNSIPLMYGSALGTHSGSISAVAGPTSAFANLASTRTSDAFDLRMDTTLIDGNSFSETTATGRDRQHVTFAVDTRVRIELSAGVNGTVQFSFHDTADTQTYLTRLAQGGSNSTEVVLPARTYLVKTLVAVTGGTLPQPWDQVHTASLTVVPEPSTSLIAGAVGCAVVRRQRRGRR